VKELNLISQDSTYYGLEPAPEPLAPPSRRRKKFSQPPRNRCPAMPQPLCTLLRELNELPGDSGIRLLYTHPAHWTDELIRTIAECAKVARYVDMPLQHIHGNMLERMRRETSQQYNHRFNSEDPRRRSGHHPAHDVHRWLPGRDRRVFLNAGLRFIRETRFERLGVFTYSKEEGTRAGGMAGQITGSLEEKAAHPGHGRAAHDRARDFRLVLGRTLRVLVEAKASARE